MFKRISFILAITLVSSLCAQQTINGSITHDGMQRTYILYVPANYTGSAAVPLLFNFHGYTSNANQQMLYGNFRPIADTAGFIIVHPQGTLDGSGTTHFNVGFGGSTVDDVGFTAALIDSLSADYNIDANRIYSTGMSNGGFMSFHLACNLSDRFAAVASVTGSMVPATMTNCNATHMTPILQMHGTSDGTVPYNGAGWTASIPNVIDHWVNFNACSTTPIYTALPNTNTTDGCTAESFEYQNVDGCVTVKHIKITNGGHTWPGSIINLAGTCYDFSASLEIWKFLSRFDINGAIGNCQSLSVDALADQSLSIYPNPSQGEVHIDGLSDEWQTVEVATLSGKVLFSDQVNAQQNTLDLSFLEEGYFLIRLEDETHAFLKVN